MLRIFLITLLVQFAATESQIAVWKSLISLYNNFTVDLQAIFDGLDDKLMNGVTDGQNMYGPGQILSFVNTKMWPITAPPFDDLIDKYSNTSLTDAYGLMLKAVLEDPNLIISMKIFAENATGLEQDTLNKLNATVAKVNFELDDLSNFVNSALEHTFASKLDEPYVIKGTKFPRSQQSLILNTVSVRESWESSGKEIGSASFGKNGQVELFELNGTFPYIRTKTLTAINLPFKSNNQSLVLILFDDINEDSREDIGDFHSWNKTRLRVQLPRFRHTYRTPLLYNSTSTLVCNVTEADFYLNFMDDVIYVNWNETVFETLSVTGAQVNIFRDFVHENPQLCASTLEKRMDESQSKNRDSRKNFEDESALSSDTVNDENSQETGDQASKAEIPSVKSVNGEILVIFNRPFQWSVWDESLNYLVTATVVW